MSAAVCHVQCRCSVNRPPVCGWFICWRMSNVLSTHYYMFRSLTVFLAICFHKTAVLMDYLGSIICIMYKAHNVVSTSLYVCVYGRGFEVYKSTT